MSAFFVQNGTIDNVVTAIMPSAMTGDDMANELGRKLMMLNLDSLQVRYDLPGDELAEYVAAIDAYTYVEQKQSDAQNLKSMNCWMYQSCESDDVLASKLYKTVEKTAAIYNDALSKGMTRSLYGFTAPLIPGYDDAEWDMSRKVQS